MSVFLRQFISAWLCHYRTKRTLTKAIRIIREAEMQRQ
jgi:hypothetical protein